MEFLVIPEASRRVIFSLEKKNQLILILPLLPFIIKNSNNAQEKKVHKALFLFKLPKVHLNFCHTTSIPELFWPLITAGLLLFLLKLDCNTKECINSPTFADDKCASARDS